MPLDTNYEVKITGIFQGRVFQNVLHFQQTAGAGGGRTVDAGRLAAAVSGQIIPLMVAACTPDTQFNTVRVTEVGIADPIVTKVAVNTPGEASGDALPGQDAILFVKRCNTGGRRNVGKFYLVGAADDNAQGGIVDTEFAPFVALAAILKGQITNTGNTYSAIIWHRATSSAEFVTICNTRAQVSRQKRRNIPVL